MKLLEVLNNRYAIAKDFTKKYTDEVKICLEDYKCEKTKKIGEKTGVTDRHISQKRYELPIPYIYSTHESMLSSLFDKPLDIILSDKGKLDEGKSKIIKAVYKYLYDKLDLDDFLNQSAWWFILTGFVSSYQTYEIKISGFSNVLDSEGQPMFEGDQPISTPLYEWHDPVVFVDDPFKTFFSPESEFTVKGDKIPYTVREKLVPKDDVIDLYDLSDSDIEAGEKLEVDGFKAKSDEAEKELQRVKVLYYCGTLPKDIEDMPEDMQIEANKKYHISFTPAKVLDISENNKTTAISKWFGSPIDFFGFGIGKTLRSQQKEMSIRRGQQVRYADLHAFPWLQMDSKTKIDQNALQDVEKRKPLIFSGQPASYLVPPPMPQTITEMDQMSRSDAQFISGTLDLSKGAQDTNTVKTATGQQLFAQSQDKRIQKARRALGKYFKYVVVNLFELARDNWDEAKIISITDENGGTEDIKVSGSDLQDINFDTDIDFQIENITVNKDTLAERSIALYDKVKDDPLIDREKVFKDMLREGFMKKNPDNYILPPEERGTQATGNKAPEPDVQPTQETPVEAEQTQTDEPIPSSEPTVPDLTQPYEQSLGGNDQP